MTGVSPSMRTQYQRRKLALKMRELQDALKRGDMSVNDVRKALGLRPFPVQECDERAGVLPVAHDHGDDA